MLTFYARCRRADAAQGRLLLYQLSAAAMPLAIDLGLTLIKYGEEARVDLATFALADSARKPLRHAMRRVEKDGGVFAVVPRAQVAAIIPDLRLVSDAWLRGRREKRFSVGRFDPDYLARFDCATVRVDGKLVAFANIWATADSEELSADLMRHLPDCPPRSMDYLFTHLILHGQALGFRWFNLGLAPLSGLADRRLAPLWARIGSFIYRHGDSHYGFEGLRDYKQKFLPAWEPRYIASPSGVGLVRALVDLQALVGGPRPETARLRLRFGGKPAVRSENRLIITRSPGVADALVHLETAL